MQNIVPSGRNAMPRGLSRPDRTVARLRLGPDAVTATGATRPIADAATAQTDETDPDSLLDEAGDPLDYALRAERAQACPGALATGENLFSHQDGRNLLRHGGMRPDRDWMRFDCSLSCGLVEYLRTLRIVEEMGWSPRRIVPHGGRQLSPNMAAGLHLGGDEAYPDVFRPCNGFADDIPVEDGHVRLPDSPGIGFERRGELMAALPG